MSKVAPHFDAILALVASGLPIAQALRSNPQFPGKPTWKSYVHDKRFQERRQRLEAAKAEGKGKRFRFHTLTEEQYSRSLEFLQASDPSIPMRELEFGDLPAYATLWNRARSDAQFAVRLKAAMAGRERGRPATVYSAEHYTKAISTIRASGHRYYRENSAELGLPHYSHIIRHARKHAPAIGRQYFEATAILRDDTSENLKASLLANDIYRRVDRSVPREHDSREDIIADMVAAVLAGEMVEDQIEARCAEYVTRHNRMFSRFKALSLDVPIYDDSRHNMVDRLTTDAATSWDY